MRRESMPPIIATETGKQFTPCPPALTTRVCVDVIATGQVGQEVRWGKEGLVHKSPSATVTDLTGTKNRFQRSRSDTPCPSTRRPPCARTSRRGAGRSVHKEELKGFDLENLIGQLPALGCPCALPYGSWPDLRDVQSVMALAKGVERLVPVD